MGGEWRYQAGDLVWLRDHPGARIGLIREALWSASRGPLYELEPLRPAYAPGVTLVIGEDCIERVVGKDGSTDRVAPAPPGSAWAPAPGVERRRVTLPVLVDRRGQRA